jgi:hypothetical protein
MANLRRFGFTGTQSGEDSPRSMRRRARSLAVDFKDFYLHSLQVTCAAY